MANAKKCDICGNYYESYNTKKNPKKVNGFMFVNKDDELCGFYGQDIVDCCPTCMRAVQTFVTYLKECDIPTATQMGMGEFHDVQKAANARACLLEVERDEKMTKDEMRDVIDEAIRCLDIALLNGVEDVSES